MVACGAEQIRSRGTMTVAQFNKWGNGGTTVFIGSKRTTINTLQWNQMFRIPRFPKTN
jgi:hypothetical protein